MKKVLLTGFDPFGGEQINPSWEIAKSLEIKNEQIYIQAVQLPCVFDKSLEGLYRAIQQFKPDIVICLGQAGGRSDISIERVAINLNDAAIADNEGNQPIDTEIIPNAPTAYFSTLPCKAILKELKQAGIPSSISLSAGSYVCNHTMYGLLNYLAHNDPNCRGGFIHIPYLPEQGVNHRNTPTMSKELLEKGIMIAIQTCLNTEQDIFLSDGKIC